MLLKPSLNLQLLPYTNGKSAPTALGSHAKRLYTTAITTGPYAPGRGAAGAGGFGGADDDDGSRRVQVVRSSTHLPCSHSHFYHIITTHATTHRLPRACACYIRLSQIDYTEGDAHLRQIWDVRGPTFVKEDWRPGERFRAQIALPAAKYNSLEKMLFNVALFTPFAAKCADFFNERLTEGANTDWDRKNDAW